MNPPPPITKQPHYVWRYYLQAWEGKNKKLIAFRNGTIFENRAAKVATEGGFHDLRAITWEDEAFLRAMVVRSGSASEAINLKYIDDFVVMRSACDKVLSNPRADKESKVYAKYVLRNFEERIQTDLESKAIPWIDSLRVANADFVRVRENTLYYLFLAMQYFRTKRMMTNVVSAFSGSIAGVTSDRVERIWQLMRHISATNVGYSLYQDREKFKTVFLRSDEQNPFITAAQPIVNTYRTGSSLIAPEDLEFYYPLSPTLAMLHTEGAHGEHGSTVEVTPKRVDFYNRMMIDASPDYFFGSNRPQIEAYAATLKNDC